MITERTLRKWRKEALSEKQEFMKTYIKGTDPSLILDLCNCILKMTQELLDQYLIGRGQ